MILLPGEGNYILDDSGNPILCTNLIQWSKWMENGNRNVARNTINGITLSTVFLGLDHNFSNSGIPVLWETMIFNGKQDEYMLRYTNREVAIKTHEQILKKLRLNQGKKSRSVADMQAFSSWFKTGDINGN